MRLFLVRHGRTAWNAGEVFRGREDIPLDHVGETEAGLLAERLRGERIEVIFSSPLMRAKQTALRISEQTGASVVEAEELIDLDYGQWQGRTLQEVKVNFPGLYELWIKKPHEVVFPSGEGLKDVLGRVAPFVETVLEGFCNRTVAFVTHKVVLKVIICHLLGMGLSAFWKVEQSTSALNLFEYRDGLWRAKLINDTCHLASLKEGGVEF